MTVLGIECTAHTLGIGVVEKKGKEGVTSTARNTRILANAHSKFSGEQGFVPRDLADHHAQAFPRVLESALAESGKDLEEVDAVAYSFGPGIGHCLHAGYVAAKSLALFGGKKMVPVNHTIAHLEVARFLANEKWENCLFAYVSGGNTQIAVFVPEERKIRVVGETMDIGLGNFLDRIGRMCEAEPADAVGVGIEAERGKYVPMPYSVKGMNLVFSGLLTQAKSMKRVGTSKEDLCFSAQETAFSMYAEALERALCLTEKKSVVLCGGNARSKRLAEILGEVCREQKKKFYCCPFEFAGDNGAMIALAGMQMLEAEKRGGEKIREEKPNQKVRLDSKPISWA